MTKILTISLPVAMAQEIDYRSRGRRGRSEWIRDAIQSKLNGNPDGDMTIVDASTRQLMAAISARDDCPEKLHQFILLLL
jgi:metal-responsive CopG/Arc/MetJ family transcriptional regulator